MGTAHDWMWVGCYVIAVWGLEYLIHVFFEAGRFLPATRDKVAFVASGFFAGIIIVFNSRLFQHSPLVLVVAALAITLFFAGSRWRSLRQWFAQRDA
jgi:hypothetical protein